MHAIRRLKLIVNTQMDMAYGYANYLAANDPTVLEQWPCQEMVRIASRKTPRAWHTRWSEHGGKFYDGRMIARKDSPIWSAISRFGNPYPPFDYESGMGVEDVDYDEAVSLGIITEGEQVQAEVKQFNEGLESSVKNLTPKEQGWLKHLLKDKVSIEDGVAKWVASDASAAHPPGAVKKLEPRTKKSDDKPSVPPTDSPPASPPVPDQHGNGGEDRASANDPKEVFQDVQAALAEFHRESFGALPRAEAEAVWLGINAQITSAALGTKPLYFDSWPDPDAVASALDKAVGRLAEVKSASEKVFVYRPEVIKGILDGNKALYRPNGENDFAAVLAATESGDNGELLGYGAKSIVQRPAVRVIILTANGDVVLGFHVTPELEKEITRRRLSDLESVTSRKDFIVNTTYLP